MGCMELLLQNMRSRHETGVEKSPPGGKIRWKKLLGGFYHNTILQHESMCRYWKLSLDFLK